MPKQLPPRLFPAPMAKCCQSFYMRMVTLGIYYGGEVLESKELREDGGIELRENGTNELREN